MFDLIQLSDDDLRVALFDALIKRLDVKGLEDSSITVVNRMPAAFALSRRGNLLTLTQGIGLRLLRGDIKWKNRREPRIFNVERATIPSKLAIMPDRIEGAPDEILDRIVAMFLEWTATGEDSWPTSAEPLQESRPTPLSAARQSRPSPSRLPEQSRATGRVPHPRSPSRDAVQERLAPSAESTQVRLPAAPRTSGESQPAAVEPTDRNRAAPRAAGDIGAAKAAPPRLAPVREPTPKLRTYQLLFETTQLELSRAKAVPSSSRYSLIGAGVFVALSAEAFFNDLGSRVIPSWSQLQRLDPREKAEVLSIELFNIKVNWSIRPFRSVAEALGFRRALAHAHAETLSFNQVRAADREESEVPRTRHTAWREYCDVATIQRWITDVHLVIEQFARAHDATEVAIGMVEQPSARSGDGRDHSREPESKKDG